MLSQQTGLTKLTLRGLLLLLWLICKVHAFPKYAFPCYNKHM